MAKADLNITTNNDVSQAVKSFDQIKNAAKKAGADIRKDGINISDELASKNREQTKELVGRFTRIGAMLKMIGFIAGNLKKAFFEMAEEGNKLREVAKSIGVSAETMAALRARAGAAGIGLKEYESALDDLRSGRTTIDELSRSWKNIAKDTYGAKEANDRFFENLSGNIEAISTSKNVEKFRNYFKRFWRESISGLVWLSGNGSEAESTIEYAVQQGIRGERGRDKAVRAAIREQLYSPVEGTTMWNARYKELSALFDSRASAVDTERRNSRDDRITSLYDKLGENVGLVMNALSRLGLGSLTETEITEAVNRSRARETTREKDDRAIRAILKEDAELRKANDAAEREAAAMDKMLLSYAYARGGGLLSGINYGFALPQKADRKETLLEQIQKRQKSFQETYDKRMKEFIQKMTGE